MAGIAQNRFTVWVSDEEDSLIRKLAAKQGTSVNFIMRIAVRKLFDLPTPPLAIVAAKEVTDAHGDDRSIRL